MRLRPGGSSTSLIASTAPRPYPLVLDFPWGAQEFWGDGRVYMWPRGHWAPSPVIAGLMALEEWAFSQVEGGRSVDEVIRDVLEGHQSSSVLSIAVALALSSQYGFGNDTAARRLRRKSGNGTSPDLCRRCGSAGIASNLIGFTKRGRREHGQAVRKSNGRPVRRMDIRWLAQLVRDQRERGAEDASAKRRSRHFRTRSRSISRKRKATRGTSQTNAVRRRFGRNGASWRIIARRRRQMVQEPTSSWRIPQQTAPDVVAATERSARMNDRLGLLHWAKKSLEGGSIETSITVQEAVDRARAIDRIDLFAEQHGQINDADLDRSAVAAVAAAVLRCGGKIDPVLLAWSKDVIFRAAATPQLIDQTFFPGSKHIHHPCDFAISGLEGLVLREEDARAAKEALLRLAGHPLEEVSEKAISVALSMWGSDPVFAWAALRLGVRSLWGHARCVRPRMDTTKQPCLKKQIQLLVPQSMSCATAACRRRCPMCHPLGFRPLAADIAMASTMTSVFGESPMITCVGISCLKFLGTFRRRRRCRTGNGHPYCSTTLINY